MISVIEIEKLNFSTFFLNQDISLNIVLNRLKFGLPVDETHSEGTVSQIFYLGLSFHLVKSRKKYFQKLEKITRFFT